MRPQLLMNAQKVPAAAVTTKEVSRVLACKSGYRLQNDKKSCDGEYFDQIKLCGVNLSNDLH